MPDTNHSKYFFKTYDDVTNIPDLWDEIADKNIFLHKDSLKILHMTNPCKQQYHINEKDKIILVSYALKLNIFTFTSRLKLFIPLRVIGLPFSVSSKGYAYQGDTNSILNEYINNFKGINLVLNADEDLDLIKGYTLSDFTLNIKWHTFDEYLHDLRSHYRYRIIRANKNFNLVEINDLENNSLFSDEMYELYLEVYENSKEKLEKLSIDFFRNYPSKIIVFSLNDQPIGFINLKENKKELIFLFCGFKHSLNQKYDLYLNMILEIVRYGILNKYKKINFGQTTEETKSKVGAQENQKYLYIASNNTIIGLLASRLIRIISYKGYSIKHRVFK